MLQFKRYLSGKNLTLDSMDPKELADEFQRFINETYPGLPHMPTDLVRMAASESIDGKLLARGMGMLPESDRQCPSEDSEEAVNAQPTCPNGWEDNGEGWV